MKNNYPQFPVLLVDDEKAWLRSFSLCLRSAGVTNLLTCNDAREAVAMAIEHQCCVTVLDLTMPHVSGEEILEELTGRKPEMPVIILTGLDTVETAVSCMKKGAFDFFTKVSEEQRLIHGVRHAIEMVGLRNENEALKSSFLNPQLKHPELFSEIISHDQGIHHIFQYMEAIAATAEPVLITGETGVGKELFARAVHRVSKRTGKFVAVNISGYDETLLADTLFGHAKGAYSGAETTRAGLVNQAEDGSLFLDEIGDLTMVAQVKLLRLIQEREYYPLGSDTAKNTNARMIFATHQDLEALQQSGKFRQDLFFRLCTHHIHIPPLRERLEDIHPLLEHFLNLGAEKLGKEIPTYPRELPILLKTYDYPGNIRELESMVFNALSKHQSHMLGLDEFSSYIERRNTSRKAVQYETAAGENLFAEIHPLPSLKDVGKLLIDEALARAEGNQGIAAQMLGITRQALNWRLQQLNKQKAA